MTKSQCKAIYSDFKKDVHSNIDFKPIKDINNSTDRKIPSIED